MSVCHMTSSSAHSYRMHCPTLITADADELLGKPKSQLSMLLKSRSGIKRASLKPSVGGVDPSWLHPILLPSIYNTLSALYREHAREDNSKLRNLIGRLSSFSEVRLCEVMGVQRSVIMIIANKDFIYFAQIIQRLC